MRKAQRYASDLTDAEWALIEPHMPTVKRPGRPRGNLYDSRNDGLFIETAAWQRISTRFASAKAWVYIASAELFIRRLG